MKPSDHPHSNHPASFLSPRSTRDVRAEDEACAPDFATHPRLPADVLTTPARHDAWPNRVHFRLGLVFRLGLLPTHPRGHAVTLGYAVVARFNWNWTFTVWFHGFINARSGGLRPPFIKAPQTILNRAALSGHDTPAGRARRFAVRFAVDVNGGLSPLLPVALEFGFRLFC